MNFNWIRTALLAATAMVSLNSFSQDLIARQAPIDRKLKSVDSLALQKQIRAEQSLYPGLDLYPSWNNEYVQAYGNAIVPESYTFDLKIADIARDGQLLQYVREVAQTIVDKDPNGSLPENEILWRQLKALRKTNVNWAAIS